MPEFSFLRTENRTFSLSKNWEPDILNFAKMRKNRAPAALLSPWSSLTERRWHNQEMLTEWLENQEISKSAIIRRAGEARKFWKFAIDCTQLRAILLPAKNSLSHSCENSFSFLRIDSHLLELRFSFIRIETLTFDTTFSLIRIENGTFLPRLPTDCRPTDCRPTDRLPNGPRY